MFWQRLTRRRLACGPTGPRTVPHRRTAMLGLALVAFWAVAGTITASADGTWTTTGVLNAARNNHTATLLPNGTVLVAGGQDSSGNALSSAELYDLASGTWTATREMATPRQEHTATLLPNGKVLVVGGTGSGGGFSSAELYDPASGTWTNTGSLHSVRYAHTATLLLDGKVLVAGGSGSSGFLSSAEVYDPASGTWTPTTGAMTTARIFHTATLLPGGKVLVAGGYDGTNSLSTAELYDPTLGTWTVTTSALNAARSQHTATLLPNGKVLVTGGVYDATNSLSTAELYDPTLGTWTVTTNALNTARFQHTATLLPNGNVLVAGGGNNLGYLSSAELYDPTNGTWTNTGTLNTARFLHTTTLLPNGKVLVAGGVDISGSSVSSAELYDSAQGTWTYTGSLNTGRYYHTATLLPNGTVLVAGGYYAEFSSAFLSSAELYDPGSGTWMATGPLTTERSSHTAILLASGKVLVAGGLGSSGVLSSAELYDPGKGTWTATGSLATERRSHTATLLPNGQVLVAGGVDNSGNVLSSAERYDPASGTWANTGVLSTSRAEHTATLLPNGQVLVAGGVDNSGNLLTTTELYDPAQGKWTPTGALNTGRYWHTATLLPNGTVLVAGGWNPLNSTLSSAELYDPASGTWTPTADLNEWRNSHTATLLPNGQVLVAAGNDNTAEFYDPASETWTMTGNLNERRNRHTATLLPNGQVLVAGGLDIETVVFSTEQYDVGLGFAEAWRPQIATFTSPLTSGNSLVLSGSGFRGLSEASSGNSQDSSTDYPLVQLRSVENEQTLFLSPEPGSAWSATSFTSGPVDSFGPGYVLATVFVNGIPSVSALVDFNTAPVLDPAKTPVLSAELENAGPPSGPVGTLINTLVDIGGPLSNVTDPDPGAVTGIALISTTNTAPGAWYYSINNGSTWIALSALSPSSALLLAADGNTRLYFQPNANFNGTIANAVTFQAWDQTLGFNGGTADATFNGGSTAFSTATETANLTTTPVNQPPSFVKGADQTVPENAGSQTVANWATSISAGPPNESSQAVSFVITGNSNPGLFSTAPAVTPNGTLTYTPAENASGSATITLVLHDNGGTANGGVDTSPPQTFVIRVTGTFAAPVWTLTGAMNVARFWHTATLLPDGQVLVAGGWDGPDHLSLSSAEVYDPASGTWTVTGELNGARLGQTATLLPNGQVLVAGGWDLSVQIDHAIAQLYDPASGTWINTGALNVARDTHTATLLPNGQVLVAGGWDSSNNELSSAELYDPVSGTWMATGPLNTARAQHTATLLPNGQVLVAGGYAGGTEISSAELYDPASGTWTTTAALNVPRDWHTATLLPSGQVLIAGGWNGSTHPPSAAELYDPVSGTWTTTGGLNVMRYMATATLLPNGQVLVTGGSDFSDNSLSSVEVYDPNSGTWTSTWGLSVARCCQTATLLSNGKVLVAGGADINNNDLSSAELYDSSQGAWTNTGALNTARQNHAATLLSNGKVLVAGGQVSDYYFSNSELYDRASGTWTTTGDLITARAGHRMTLLPDGTVLVTGGGNDTSGPLSRAELYDPASGTWTDTGALNTARWSHTATLLTNGKVLVAGGEDSDGIPLSSAELYDPASRSWTTTGPLNEGRYSHTAILLTNGMVLVAGGWDGNFDLYSAELYDPTSGTWSETGPLNTARHGHTATVLPNGTVLIAGGGDDNDNSLSSAELYDPASETWAQTGMLNVERDGHTATLLLDGRVLVVGGYNNSSPNLSSAEVYEPASGVWTATGPLNTGRWEHTATLLPDGAVLVAGSWSFYSAISGAELYDIGLGFADVWRPQITACTSPLSVGNSLVLSGSGFRGLSEASSGNSQDSPTDYPLVQLRSVDSEQTVFLSPAPGSAWSATSFKSVPVGSFGPGYALATVFVNGIPSVSAIVATSQATLPTISCPGNITVTNDPGQCTALVAFNVSATGTPAPTVQCLVGATAITSPFAFPVGTTTVNCTANNGIGLATCSFTVTVNERPPLVDTALTPTSFFSAGSISSNEVISACGVYDGSNPPNVPGLAACPVLATVQLSSPRCVAVGDLDADGRPDVVVGNAGYVAVFRNDSPLGNLSCSGFTPSAQLATVGSIVRVGLADLDGDGLPDIVAVDSTGLVSVFRNLSTSDQMAFAPRVDLPLLAGSIPSGLALGDWDGDGQMDVAVANSGASSVSIYRNTSSVGNVSFGPAVTVTTPAGPLALAAADLDGDGKLDLVVVGNSGDQGFAWAFPGTSTPGAIAFGAPVDLGLANGGPNGVAVGDVNGDGLLDLAVSLGTAGQIAVLRNTSAGQIAFAPPDFFGTADAPADVTLAGLEGDSRLYLVVPNYGLNGAGYSVSVFQNTTATGCALGPNAFANRLDYVTGGCGCPCQQNPTNVVHAGPSQVAVADLDLDGRPDLVVVNTAANSVTLLKNTAAGLLGPSDSTVTIPLAVGDPAAQIIVASSNPDFIPTNAISVTGNGSSQALQVSRDPTQLGSTLLTVTASAGALSSTENIVVSAQVPSFFGNIVWPLAAPLTLQTTSFLDSVSQKVRPIMLASVQEYLDRRGLVCWFKVPVQPDSKFIVALTGLPANYDLAVFKDIAKAFTAPTDADDLVHQNAQSSADAFAGGAFAPTAFSPTAFSPTAFSPTAFSPTAFSPTAFSPTAFSPTAFSPTAFSPTAFSPTAFSPTAFSPTAFSPTAFSPTAFSPTAFSPTAFSPTAFSPTAFSPTAFSPTAFSPTAFSPTAFSPTAFSPTAFSPTAFSPTAFSPTAFSPTAFSATNFSENAAFSPTAFSPILVFSSAVPQSLIGVSAFDGTAPEGLMINTWNSSETWYVAVVGRDGAFSTAAPFTLSVAMIPGDCSGSSTALPASTTVAASGNYKTIILTDLGRIAGTSQEKWALEQKLNLLASKPEVQGIVLDLGGLAFDQTATNHPIIGATPDAQVLAANARADAALDCPFERTAVAEAIKGIIQNYRSLNPGLEYIVLAGNDSVIPFFRHPDQTDLGAEDMFVPPVEDESTSQASLRLNNFLSQDDYGAVCDVSIQGQPFPMPVMAVGRLVETPTEIMGMIDAYLDATRTALDPGSNLRVVRSVTNSLVTGYDFLAAGAQAIQHSLAASMNAQGAAQPVVNDSLITPATNSPQDQAAWTADQLRPLLLGYRHDLMFLAAHFSDSALLAANYDYTNQLLSPELLASPVDLTDAIIVSGGCHSGYNTVDMDEVPGITLAPDWAQCFARKKATLIGGSGYQYGDTDFIAYSQQLYVDFFNQLCAGTGPVAIGKALLDAKQAYLNAVSEVRPIDTKALLEATLYGLPMLAVKLPSGGGTLPDFQQTVHAVDLTPATNNPGLPLGLSSVELTFHPALTANPVTLTIYPDDTNQSPTHVTGSYLSGSNGVVSHPNEPILPLEAYRVGLPNMVLRGVAFLDGTYSDGGDDATSSSVLPLTGAPATEIRGVHVAFVTDVFYPIQPWRVNYYQDLCSAQAGANTRLMLLPAQYLSNPPGSQTGLRRKYSEMHLRLYYNTNANLLNYLGAAVAPVPTIDQVSDSPAPGNPQGVVVQAQVVGSPLAGVQAALVSYTGVAGSLHGTWHFIALSQNTNDSTTWSGIIDLTGETTAPLDVRYLVQAVSGSGLVALDTHQGAFYAPQPPQTTPPAPTVLTLQALSGGQPLDLTQPILYGQAITLQGTLTTNGQPVSGQTVTFNLGRNQLQGVTTNTGTAQVTGPLFLLPGPYQFSASYPGVAGFAAAQTSPLGFTLAKRDVILTAEALGGAGVCNSLLCTLSDGVRPLADTTVFLAVTNSANSNINLTLSGITDYAGRLQVDQVPLPAGTYTVTAYFTGTQISGLGGNVTLTDVRYNPTAPPTAQLNITPVSNQVELVDTNGQPLTSVSIAAGSSLDLQALVTPPLTGALINYEIKTNGGNVVARTIGAVASDGTSEASFPQMAAGSYSLHLTLGAPCLQSVASTTTILVSVIDRVPPTINCPANIVQSTDPGQCSAVVTWKVVAADDSGSVNLACTAGSATVTPASTTGFGNPSTITYTATFPKGVTQVHCVATDPSGNTSTGNFTVTINDTEAPQIGCPADLVLTPDAGSCSAVATYQPTATDNCPGVSVVCNPPSGSRFGVGTTPVICVATDSSGNTAACSFSVRVVGVDTTPPAVSCPAAITVSVGAHCQAAVPNVLPNVTVSDNCTPTSMIGLVQSPAAGTLVGLGPTILTVTATDASGNHSSCVTTLTVIDTQPPTITAPADVTANTDPGKSTASNVALGTPITGDNCSVASVVNNAPASFPLGTTTVTWTVKDGSGNSATATQKVTVMDNQPPTITPMANVTVNTDPGKSSASNVALGTPITWDNCSVASVVNNAPASFPLGTTTVTWTVKDGSGNTTTATQKVTVMDNQPPTITAPANVTVNTDPGQCSASKVALGTPTAADNCGVACVSSNAPGVFPKGSTVVTWTATDTSGNTATAAQLVTVVDKQPPTITCPTAVTIQATSLNGAVVNFSATVSDNCPGATVSCSPASGTLFPLGNTTVTVTALDTAGNSAVATFNITVLADLVLNGPLVINGGTLKGSVQQLAGNPVTLNSKASITGDLLVPGTPSVVKNGQVTLQGTIVGTGSSQPSGYAITLNSGVSLRCLRTRMNPVTIPSVPAPPAPTGTRSVTLTSHGQSPGDFSTIRNLTLNGSVGQVAVPPGNYGSFTANGACGFTLGTAGSTVPVTYDFQSLTLNSGTQLSVVGPVIVVLANSLTANGMMGVSSQPTWLQLKIASGGVTLNSGATLAGLVTAPGGTVIINGSSVLIGALECNQLTINSNGVLQGSGN